MNRKIKSIGIKNFQSWEDEVINFEDFNILEGKSNSGKSAIVRAISMVINDDWDTSWIRKGESVTTADLLFTDGLRIVRSRGSVNNILVYKGDKLIETFTDFGRSYPEEVRNLLNTDDYNIANQFDGHFFISLSPNKRAQILGKFSDLGRIDSLLAENQRLLRQANSNSKFLDEHKEELEYELSMVDDIVDSLPRVSEFSDLNELINDTSTLTKRLEKIKDLIKIENQLSLEGDLIVAAKLFKECNFLKSQLSVISFNKEIENSSNNINKLQKKIEGHLCPICSTKISF